MSVPSDPPHAPAAGDLPRVPAPSGAPHATAPRVVSGSPAPSLASQPSAASVAVDGHASQPSAASVAVAGHASPPAAKVPQSADDLYRGAESALRRHDPRTAERVLGRLVAEFPQSPLVEQALYDRARIAYQQRSWSAAREHLRALLALPSPRLVEQARYLDCRIAVETNDHGAAACLAAYRRAYPRSPHAAEVLAWLVQLDYTAGGCRAAAAQIAELAQQYPRGKLASAWRARCPSRSEKQ